MSSAPTLFLTRPAPQSQSFLQECEARLGREVANVITPIIEIKALGGDWDLTGETLVITSSNAVRLLGARLKGRNVATVGEATAERARGFGAKARCLGETAESFLANCDALQPPVLICRGRHARRDLAVDLSERGITARDLVIYDQVEKALSVEGQSLLQAKTPLILPLFSPRSARLLSAYSISAPVTCAALSPAVADAWTGPGRLEIAQSPNARSMCDLVTAFL